MATPAVNDIVQIKLIGAFVLTPYDRLVTTLNYRCHVAGSPTSGENEHDMILADFKVAKLPRLCDNLPVTYQIFELRCQTIYPANASFEAILPLSNADGGGELAITGTSSQTAAACITRRSYKPGRRGIGRVFFGPLGPQFMSGDTLDPDPTGDGDLRDVVSALGENVESASGGEYHPCIFGTINPTGASTDAEMDVRVQTFAPLISHLRSRRLNSI